MSGGECCPPTSEYVLFVFKLSSSEIISVWSGRILYIFRDIQLKISGPMLHLNSISLLFFPSGVSHDDVDVVSEIFFLP